MPGSYPLITFIQFNDGVLAPSASGTFTVDLTGTGPGEKDNKVSVSSSEGGTSEWVDASVDVVAPSSPAGARMLTDIGDTLGDPDPTREPNSVTEQLPVIGDTLYFIAWDGVSDGLWKYDDSGFSEVMAGPSLYDPSNSSGQKIQYLTPVGSTLYFRGPDDNDRPQLWQYNGSGSPTLVTAGPAFSAQYGASPLSL